MVSLADELVPLIFGEKWVGSVELFQILSIYAMIRSTTSPAGALLLSRGRADIGFWWSLGEFSLMPLIIYIGSHWGIVGVSLGLLGFQIIILMPNWYFIVKRMCGASFREYFRVQFRPLLAIILSTVPVYFILDMEVFPLFKIIIVSFVLSSLYLLSSYWLNKNFVEEIISIFSKKVKV